MLGLTGVVDARSARAQYLDRMDIERERGITIKSQAVRMPWTVKATKEPLDGDQDARGGGAGREERRKGGSAGDDRGGGGRVLSFFHGRLWGPLPPPCFEHDR